MPVVFVSHGAPDALLKAPDAVACWREIGKQAPVPAAVLVVSAHWQARSPTLDLAGAPETLHDFSGFAPSLHRMQYPAPGAPALAEHAASLIAAAGMTAELHPDRGLDHGAWVPLSAMYPDANMPVAQLSLVRNGSAATHLALGQALAPLRDEGVLILASGAITHNFDWLDWQGEADPLPQARAFSDWVGERLAAQDVPALLDYRSAQCGAAAHPTEEHFLPLLVALGAAGNGSPVRRQPRYTHGSLSMDAYVW
jgi:4,5-DOPA dioxygenase extradiol